MNKTELTKAISEKAKISQTAAGNALNAFIDAVTDSLNDGGNVTLVGFGTFSVTKRAARNGRNPQTGKKIKIAAKNVAKFRPGKKLTEAVK